MHTTIEDHTHCSFCQAPLAWWNVSTCAQCGKTICRHHTCLVKRAHSRVLASVCEDCANRVNMHLETLSASRPIKQTVATHHHPAAR